MFFVLKIISQLNKSRESCARAFVFLRMASHYWHSSPFCDGCVLYVLGFLKDKIQTDFSFIARKKSV